MGRGEAFTPESLDEVGALLLAADEAARPVFEGVRLLARLGPPDGGSLALDLSRVPELNRLEFDERDGLRIGSAVRLDRALTFAPIRQHYSALADGLEECLGQGDGAATWAEALARPAAIPGVILPLLACQASAGVYGPYGWSELAVESLCQPGRSTLQFGEFVVHLSLPAAPVRSGGAYASQMPPHGGPLGVAAVLVMEEDLATCCGARLLRWAEEGGPERAVEGERFLAGKRLDGERLERAGMLAEQGVPLDARGRAEDRQGLGRLAAQVLRTAWSRLAR
jgi:carbon-monoxide dehydrogenase medium subunit